MYDLRNDYDADPKKLRPIGGPWSIFTRMRILAGGQILDIDMYNRVHEMFSIFGTTESRINDFSEGFNNYWEHRVDTDDLTEVHLKGIH
ncbi:MAG: hypothetical protein ACKPKO_24460 [Candidatus Fonsibacter sp.]